MPDITMCKNNTCPLREDCYRFKAKPNGEYQQSYAWFESYVLADSGVRMCEHYLPMARKEKRDE